MNANDQSPAPIYRQSDPRQVRTYERLARLVAPGPAAFFLDACRLMEESRPFRSTTHLVAHLLREIESALRDVLEPISRWPERRKATKNNSKEAHADEVRCVLGALEIPEDHPVAKAWLGLTSQSAEGALHRRAHRSSLMAARPLDTPFLEFWESMQVVLDLVLTRLESNFLAYREKLDKLLAKDEPDTNDIALLRGNIPNSLITWQYFFSELKSPLWVKPLREAGIFKEIPEPVEVEGGVSCPPWPAADYLQRSLTKVPDEISRILDEAPLTDNWRAVYALAIQQIGTESSGGGLETRDNHPLISHLMVLYWRGQLDLRGGLLEDFYSRASAAMRGSKLAGGRPLHQRAFPAVQDFPSL